MIAAEYALNTRSAFFYSQFFHDMAVRSVLPKGKLTVNFSAVIWDAFDLPLTMGPKCNFVGSKIQKGKGRLPTRTSSTTAPFYPPAK